MNEEEIENHFDENHDELQAYKKQLDLLKDDLKLLIKHSPSSKHDLIYTANQSGNQYFDQSDVKKCREFLERYEIQV
jgi:hypothetical protein